MPREYNVVLLSDPTAILGEIRNKNSLGLKSKVPFNTDRLEPNLYCHNASVASTMYSVTPLQSQGDTDKKLFRPQQ
jgi:hypothetical protein